MSKPEQVLNLDPPHELRFRGKLDSERWKVGSKKMTRHIEMVLLFSTGDDQKYFVDI